MRIIHKRRLTFRGGGWREGREREGRNGVDFSRRAFPGEAEIYRILRQVRGDGGRAGQGRAGSSRPHNKHITVILKTIISRASQPSSDDLTAPRGMAPLSQFVVELIPGLATV